MRTTHIVAVLVLISSSTSLAADQPLTPQQTKMVTCNQEAKAKGVSGADRQAFMSECLKTDKTAALTPQQQKMHDCNAHAAGKKGDERKAFMKQCLSAATP